MKNEVMGLALALAFGRHCRDGADDQAARRSIPSRTAISSPRRRRSRGSRRSNARLWNAVNMEYDPAQQLGKAKDVLFVHGLGRGGYRLRRCLRRNSCRCRWWRNSHRLQFIL